MRYPGGKNSGGLYQRIICQMPPHRVYCEPFLGSGAILRMKRPAEVSYGIDLDPGAVGNLAGLVPEGTVLLCDDGIAWLYRERWMLGAGDLVYADPPYLATLTAQRYAHKLDLAGHRRLLRVLRALPCRVLISGYHSDLYDDVLSEWRMMEIPAWTRGGPAMECLWANFPEPEALHDYRYLGEGKRQRLDIHRQQARWRRKLMGMDRLRRQALLSVLAELGPGGGGESAARGSGDGVLAACRSTGGNHAARGR